MKQAKVSKLGELFNYALEVKANKKSLDLLPERMTKNLYDF